MRENMGLYIAKRTDNGEWVEGDLLSYSTMTIIQVKEQTDLLIRIAAYPVDPSTVGQFTGLYDKNGNRIFEGDIVQYMNEPFDGFDCQSVVRFGEYPQDGSGGEYKPTRCLGYYVDVDNFTCPDWANNDPNFFPEYDKKRSILEVVDRCEVIGNVTDNPELIRRANDADNRD